MRRGRWLFVAALTGTALMIAGLQTPATEKIAQKEKLDCLACHVKPEGKKLSDRGKYFETLGTLEGYDRLTERFGNCMHCHKTEPGSKKLTRKGKRVRKVVRDMKGLFDWLKEGHTGPIDE